MPCNLLLHCGAHAVPRPQLATTPTPSPTRSWMPIPHEAFVGQVEDLLPHYGLKVVNEAHALTHDSARYFGLLEIQNGSNHPDYTWVLGLRNSHDQSLPAGLVAGSSVFVCDNLAFVGTVKVSRKHTRFILRDLPELAGNAIERLVYRWHDQGQISSTRWKEVQVLDKALQQMNGAARDTASSSPGTCGASSMPSPRC